MCCLHTDAACYMDLHVSCCLCSGAFKDIRPSNWCLSEKYQGYLSQPADDSSWKPDHEYYVHMVSRLVNSILVAYSLQLKNMWEGNGGELEG